MTCIGPFFKGNYWLRWKYDWICLILIARLRPFIHNLIRIRAEQWEFIRKWQTGTKFEKTLQIINDGNSERGREKGDYIWTFPSKGCACWHITSERKKTLEEYTYVTVLCQRETDSCSQGQLLASPDEGEGEGLIQFKWGFEWGWGWGWGWGT
jgi:hypothetical protein